MIVCCCIGTIAGAVVMVVAAIAAISAIGRAGAIATAQTWIRTRWPFHVGGSNIILLLVFMIVVGNAVVLRTAAAATRLFMTLSTYMVDCATEHIFFDSFHKTQLCAVAIGIATMNTIGA